MRRLLLLLLIACNASSPSPSPPAAPGPKPVAPTPTPVLTAAHSNTITTLAVTADGRAAVTGDHLGGIRLWPALDGTREPVVIAGPAPQSVAMITASDGFVIALLDAAGGIQLVHTAAAGDVRERLTLEAQATALEAVGDGFLVLRSDQTLAYVDPHARVRSVLAPEPGTHITSLLVRNSRVVALVQDGKKMLARHVLVDDAEHTAAWGDSSPPIAVSVKSAVLSPSGALLAVQRTRNLHPVLIEISTGKILPRQLCVERQWPTEDDSVDVQQLFQQEQTPAPVGFLSDDVIACSVQDRLIWWQTNGEQLGGNSMALTALPVVTVDKRLVVGTGSSLALVDPSVTHFLGYSFHDISRIHFSPLGMMLDHNTEEQLMLDRDLRERSRLDLGRNWLDAEAIDARYALTLMRFDGNKLAAPANRLGVYDMVAKGYHQLLPYAARDVLLNYESATRIASLMSDDNPPLLITLDPATHLFGDAMPLEAGWNSAWPVDPALANGVVAFAVATNSAGTLMLGEIHATDMHAGAPIKPSVVWRAVGSLRTIDRRGRVYISVGDGLLIYERGKITATSAGTGSYNITINRNATRIAAIEGQKIRVLAPTGATLWETTQWGTSSIGWDDDDLVVQFPGGLAKLDPATGAVSERRCGWGFGLSDQMPETGQNLASICDAAH